MLNTKLFSGNEYSVTVYNGQPLINVAFRFYTEDNCDGEQVDYDFPDFTSGFLRVFNERGGRELKDFTLTQSGAYLVANISALDATFEDAGNYYYEVGYVQSNVYEQVLRYGKFIVI